MFSDTTIDESEETYRGRLNDAIVEFGTDDDATRGIDYLQNTVRTVH